MRLKNVIIIIVLLAAAIFLIPYSIPLILALVTALVLEPAIKLFINNFKIKRLLSVTIVFILFLAGFGIFTYWLTTTLVVQTIDFLTMVPKYAVKVFSLIENDLYKVEKLYASLPPEALSTVQNALDGFKDYAGSFATKLTNGIIAVAAAIPQLLLYLIIYLVALFLISLDLPRLFANFLNLFTTSAREKVELVFTQLSRATVGFIRAQLILSFITYVLALIGLLILDVKYAVLIALFIILVDILPILGTGSFIVPWAIYNFIVGDDFLAIGLIIMFVVLTVIRRIIEPKILGSSLGISALAALISLYLGFQLLGFIGLIVGPALVIIYEALRSAGFIKIKIDF
ncbi:sporulation integral membrane protein YtvI [Fictibacillus enclensis]|uniref:sporulation integral membrane protein YtvI n=1 Tax=Fictibacillus enclensis TaxID=1017270 RepID=UPI0024C088A2|nr:sporulation integral membrane protein YtvI [Fictibacillus enclensis]MDM5336934.1 sporulation integral membrane protein YtvI [Fictibacillus enclensis]WHY73356.1 sporulation integral membrane protein YtvI [Fictibacillus enclensis]